MTNARERSRGGSIGSELCRQIARYHPATLILFERYENGLFALDLELRAQHQRIAATLFGDDLAAFNRLVRDRNVPAVVIK